MTDLISFCGCFQVTTCVAVSGDGRHMACGSEDGAVRIYMIETGKVCKDFYNDVYMLVLNICKSSMQAMNHSSFALLTSKDLWVWS